MIAKWLNGRLLSIAWYWHAKNGWNVAQCYCVHRKKLKQQCWECDDKIVPSNYKVQEA